MTDYNFPLVDSPTLECEPLRIQVIHPRYTTEAQLADWFERLEVRTDPRYDILRWSTLDSAPDDQLPELIIRFRLDDQVDVVVRDWFSRPVSFLNASNDDERMQQLLDILINCWAEQGMIALDLADVYTIFKESARGVITTVANATKLPEYSMQWPQMVAPLLGEGSVTSMQCIYREHEPSLSNFTLYGNSLEQMVDENCVIVLGMMYTKKPSSPQNAVLYFGMSESPLVL